MSHTKGLLHTECLAGGNVSIWGQAGDTSNIQVAVCGPANFDHANARRLVAAWNATRHLNTEQLEAGDLDYAGCSTLADIRAALGVGGKPMLGELAGIVREVREQADRDEKAACKALDSARILRRAMCLWRDMAREYLLILRTARGMNIERAEEAEAEATRLKRERDEAVEALRAICSRILTTPPTTALPQVR